jgi:hypothetical protein
LSKNDLYSDAGKPSSLSRTSHALSPETSIPFSGGGGVVASVRSVFRLEKTAVLYLRFWLNERNRVMPVVVNGSTYAGAENAQDAAHTR